MRKPRAKAAAAIGLGVLAGVYAYAVEPFWVDWHEEAIDLPGLVHPEGRITICQLSDLHLGRSTPLSLLQRVIRECNHREPDLVVLTGDTIESRKGDIPRWAEYLRGLRARYGVVAILGGHDYWHLPELVVESLEANGVRVLKNDVLRVGPSASPLWVAGLDDNSDRWGRPNLRTTLAKIPERAPYILLMHSPDSILNVADHRVPLVLCGHTHGGQLCVPFYGPPVTMSQFGRRFVRGRHVVAKTTMYVCRGLGSHRHLRFLCRPEVLWLTLNGSRVTDRVEDR